MSIKNVKKSENTISLELKDYDISYANGLRRTLMSKIPTYAINNITVINNTTSYNNDYIKNRLELIPLKSDSDMDNVIFTLKASSEDELLDIFTESLNSSNGKKYFPGDILVLTLKPGQAIQLECSISKNIGSYHSKHSPICGIQFEMMPKDPKEKDYIYRQRNFVPNHIILSYESIGMFPADKLFTMSIDLIIDKLAFIKKSIEEENPEKIQIIKYNPMDDTYEYIIDNEDHTIGCLINNTNLENKECGFSGIIKPHPSFDKITMRVKGTPKTHSNKIMLNSISEITKNMEKIKTEFLKQIK
jgi:DNA-directed RNA polymerase subunit D